MNKNQNHSILSLIGRLRVPRPTTLLKVISILSKRADKRFVCTRSVALCQ